MRQIHRDQKQRTTKKKRWRRKKRQNSKTMKTTKKCVLQVKTVQQPSHMPLIWKCQLKAHITFLTASTGGIFSLSDTRWALCFKKLLQIEREGGGPWVFAVPKSLILTCLISIHRHRLSSVIRLNKESTFASHPKPIVCFHRPKRNL